MKSQERPNTRDRLNGARQRRTWAKDSRLTSGGKAVNAASATLKEYWKMGFGWIVVPCRKADRGPDHRLHLPSRVLGRRHPHLLHIASAEAPLFRSIGPMGEDAHFHWRFQCS